MIAHHGYGEEILFYALAGGGISVLAVFRVHLSQLVQWLRRR